MLSAVRSCFRMMTFMKKIKYNQNAMGGIASPFDSYLILRGIKTLSARMEMHNLNAMEVASIS